MPTNAALKFVSKLIITIKNANFDVMSGKVRFPANKETIK
jgi:hypothetical protein